MMQWFYETYQDVLPLRNLHILDLPQDLCSDILATLLSLDSHTFNLFWQSKILKNACESHLNNELSFKTIQQAQYTLLLSLQEQIHSLNTQQVLQLTLKKLSTLQKYNLITTEHFQNLTHFLSQISPKATHQESTSLPQNILENFFNESLKIFTNIHQTLTPFAPTNISKNLQTLITKAQEQHFSIGITGVLSAGKSTLLNALLGEEILGSSTIPETASLTILKYSQKPYAKIEFWNKQEWEELKNTLDLDYLQSLLKNQEFQDFLNQYIQDSTQSLEIPLQDLPKFTSANHPSKLCNLIKQTTLFTPLKFLENKVEIVDTPGLDDPIIQREEITKNYLLKCDLLIHAMNASQSATKVDMDFILHTLKTSHISRLLIILTHADLLPKEDLKNALAYAQESIQTTLKQNLPAHQGEVFLKRLDFLHLSSYPALLCQTNPDKAKELGYTLESSNLNALLEYLQKTLLGSNSTKAKDIIYLTAQGFYQNLKNLLDLLLLETSLLFSSKEQILALIEQHKQEVYLAEQNSKELQNTLQEIQLQLKEHLKTLNNLLNKKLLQEQNILTQRIQEDILYDYKKNQSPSKERIERILTQGLKDSLSDILRVFSQNLSNKLAQLQDKLKTTEDYNTSIELDYTMIAKTKMQILNQITPLLSKKLQESKLQETLQEIFCNGFQAFSDSILEYSQKLQAQFTATFQQHIQKTLQESTEFLDSKKQALEKSLQESKQDTQEKEAKKQDLKSHIAQISEYCKTLENLQKYATKE